MWNVYFVTGKCRIVYFIDRLVSVRRVCPTKHVTSSFNVLTNVRKLFGRRKINSIVFLVITWVCVQIIVHSSWIEARVLKDIISDQFILNYKIPSSVVNRIDIIIWLLDLIQTFLDFDFIDNFLLGDINQVFFSLIWDVFLKACFFVLNL